MIESLPRYFFPEKYDLYLHIVPEKYPFDANVIIAFEKIHDSDFIILFCHENIHIKSITQNEENIEYDISYPKIKIKKSRHSDIDFSTFPIQPSLTNFFGFYLSKNSYLT